MSSRLPRAFRQQVSPKLRLAFNGLNGVISQKKELFITTAVITSYPIGFSKYEYMGAN
jgi:hypothetical protein